MLGVQTKTDDIDYQSLKNGWLTREAARRLGIAFSFKEERLPILYDRIFSRDNGEVANKVYTLRDSTYHYLGGIIEIIPAPTATKEPYVSPLDGEVK